MSLRARTAMALGILMLMVPILSHSGETITPQQAEGDAAQLVKDLETLQTGIQALRGGAAQKAVAAKGDKGSDQSVDQAQRLAQFEKDVVAPIQMRYDDYIKKYGNSRNAIDQKFQQILGRQLRRRPSWAWEMLGPELEKARGMRSGAAESLVREAKRTLELMRSLNKDIWAKSFDKVKANLEAAVKIAPDNQEAKSLLATVDEEKAKALAELEAEIEQAEWKPHSPKFNGPGDPDELARVAFEQLRMDDEGNISDSVLAVRIRGDWRVWDEVLSVPKNYGLPVDVAYSIKDEPENAKVLRLTMVTRDNTKAPPFRGNPGVGDSYKIRRNKIPGMSGAGPFVLFRLTLAAVLVLSGILAASSLLQTLHPSVEGAIEKIIPVKALVGVVALAAGAVFFVKNLLYLSPLEDVLPQVAAVVIGLLLGLELLLKMRIPASTGTADASETPAAEAAGEAAATTEGSAEAAETPADAGQPGPSLAETADKTKEAGQAAAQKLQDMFATQEERIKSLRKHQVWLGLACIALGLLHLLVAGSWLF